MLWEWKHGFRPYKSTTDVIFCMKVLLGFKFEFENAVWNLKSTVLLWIWRKSRTTKWQSDEQWSRENRCIIPVLLLICLKNMYKMQNSLKSAFSLCPWLRSRTGFTHIGKKWTLDDFCRWCWAGASENRCLEQSTDRKRPEVEHYKVGNWVCAKYHRN